jgi:hypothetical protein
MCAIRARTQNTHPRTRPRRVQRARRNFSGAIIRSLIKRFNSAKEVVPKKFLGEVSTTYFDRISLSDARPFAHEGLPGSALLLVLF